MPKSNNPLVSIGIPVVKTSYLISTIECCLSQTYINIEILVLNNAKTKETKLDIDEILTRFDDKRIKYYSNEKYLPIIENWNKVLGYAEGEFFALLCDDDKWESTFIENLIVLSTKYKETCIFHSRVLVVNENEQPLKLSPLCYEKEDCLDFIYHRIKGIRLQFLSDFIVKTDAIKKIGGFVSLPDGWGSDDITWFKIAAIGGIAFDANPLFVYRNHPDNISNSKKLKNKFESIPIYIKYVRDIISNIPELNDLDCFKKEIIEKELLVYKKLSYISLTQKRLKNYKFIPNPFVSLLLIFYKGYKFIFGWEKGRILCYDKNTIKSIL